MNGPAMAKAQGPCVLSRCPMVPMCMCYVLCCVATIMTLLCLLLVDGLCTTKTCVTVASAILNAMDDSVRPCDDFYRFACGGWMKAHPIPASESRWNTFAVLRKQNEVVIKNVLGELSDSYVTLIVLR